MTMDLNTKPLKKGQELQLVIEKLAFGGKGIARYGDFVVFVNQTIPGQTVQARIIKKKKKHAEARLLQVIEQSPLYTNPPCSHFGACGGCVTQHLLYDEQLKAKEEQATDSLKRLGGLSGFEIKPALPSPHIYHYRNKMEYSFSRQRWLTLEEIESDEVLDREGLFIGMHARGFFDKVVDIYNCHLMDPIANDILNTVRSFSKAKNLPSYSTYDHDGFWRFLIIRLCKNTKDLMVNLVTSEYNKDIANEFKQVMMTKFPQITSLLFSISTSKASVAYSEKEYLLAGEKSITEKLGHYSFDISSNSFFQTNTKGAEQLFDVVNEFADFTGSENVYDLYCGAGAISLYISDHVRNVVGFEAVPSAIEDAHRNAERNGVTNCQFELCDLKDSLYDTEQVLSKYGTPDMMIIDPPRGGMHPKTVKAILNLKPERIVHVSCNPTTLARDLKELCEQDYELTKVQAVDMFPHTAHIEVVAQLIRNK